MQTAREARQKELLATLEDKPPLFRKVAELSDALAAKVADRASNALLWHVTRGVTIDYTNGALVFDWKHGGTSQLTYAWPEE